MNQDEQMKTRGQATSKKVGNEGSVGKTMEMSK